VTSEVEGSVGTEMRHSSLESGYVASEMRSGSLPRGFNKPSEVGFSETTEVKDTVEYPSFGMGRAPSNMKCTDPPRKFLTTVSKSCGTSKEGMWSTSDMKASTHIPPAKEEYNTELGSAPLKVKYTLVQKPGDTSETRASRAQEMSLSAGNPNERLSRDPRLQAYQYASDRPNVVYQPPLRYYECDYPTKHRVVTEPEGRLRSPSGYRQGMLNSGEERPPLMVCEDNYLQASIKRQESPMRLPTPGQYHQGAEYHGGNLPQVYNQEAEAASQPPRHLQSAKGGDSQPVSLSQSARGHGGLSASMGALPMKFKPEPYDGTSDWLEYLVYYEQLAELQRWDQATMAMVLGLSLKGPARSVLANLSLSQRGDYEALKNALTQNFCPPQQVHLYQVQLKTRKRQTNESLPELGRDIIRLTRLAYPTADQSTRETIGISSFLDALQGPALEIRLAVSQGHPTTVLEAVALAMEVDAIMQADHHKKVPVKRDYAHDGGDPLTLRLDRITSALEGLERKVRGLQTEKSKPQEGAKSRKETPVSPPAPKDRPETRSCYNCGKTGHLIKNCRLPKSQGNERGRPQSK